MSWDWKSAFDWHKRGPTKERLVIGGAGLLAIVLVAAAAGSDGGSEASASGMAGTSRSQAGAQDPGEWPGPARPALQYRNGNAFGYSVPVGWQVNETTNGVDIAAPDGVTGVSASILAGGFGRPTPQQYLVQVLQSTGQGNAHFLSVAPTPPRPGPMGLQWQGIEAEIESAQRGRRIHIQAISQVLQGRGQFVAIVTGAQGPIGDWASLKTWLPHVRDSIRIINGSIVTGSMANALPRGIDSDDVFGGYNRGWETRHVPDADISRAQREATMGYTRKEDPRTGRIWDLPLEAYDPTVGGYRNPLHPNQLLSDTNN